MPQHQPQHHRETEQPQRDTLRLPDAQPPMADLFSAMIGFAGRAHAAFAEAALTNVQQTLDAAQKAVETTRSNARDAIDGPVAADDAAPVTTLVQTIADRNIKALEEMATVAQKCTRAYLALPSELANCRTPQDVLGLQLRFWQNAAADCTAGSRRVMDALAGHDDGKEGRHVPTVAEVLSQRNLGPADRPGHRDGNSGARSEPGSGREQPRRSSSGENRLNA